MIITIDGPTASGKSTVGRMIADKVGFYYLCSGLIYRAIGYCLVHKYDYTLETITHVRLEDINECAAQLWYEYNAHSQERIFSEDDAMPLYLKDKFMDQVASRVSVNKDVRKAVTTIQHDIAHHHNIVVDGRDVGSVVFPNAEVKFFLTTSMQVRAQRWQKDQEKYGNYFPLDQAVTSITERDERDKNRATAPLVIPAGAIVIDSSLLTIEETVEKMMEYIRESLPSLLE
jgi:CMP/dCMP kinase